MKNLITFLFCLLFSYAAFSFTIVLEKKDAACGYNNGSITATVYNSAAPVNFQWSNGAMSYHNENLAPGIYTIYVTDALMSDSASIEVLNTPAITGAALSYIIPPGGIGGTHPCNDQCNGIAYLTTGGMNGTPPFAIWTSMSHQIGFSSTCGCPTVEGICSDDVYTAMVTDANGCTGTITAVPPSYPSTSWDHTVSILPACNGLNNGSVSINFTNMTSFYMHASWTGPSSGNNPFFYQTLDMDHLLPGNYTVSVIMDLGNQCDTTILVTVPDAGSNCGFVSGQVYIDTLANCQPDISEPGNPSRLIVFTPGPYYTVSDSTGNFATFLPYGTYSATTTGNHFQNVCPVTGITLSAANDSVTGVNLGDSVPTLDISVDLASSAARPGFSYSLFVRLRNNGLETVSNPEVQLDYDSALIYISTDLPSTATGTDQITIQFPALTPLSSAIAEVTFTVPPDPGLIGYILHSVAIADANQPESFLANNADTGHQPITGSFDPNDKAVWPSRDPMNLFNPRSGSVFRYTIRFQNTGNDTAFNVMITDTLDEYLDISTFSVKGFSHNSHWNFTEGDVLSVYFDNILLPDSNVNEPESHGLFSFEIRPTAALQSVPLPYTLENTANIYFDFNPPIITNVAFSTIDILTGVSSQDEKSFSIRPNPVKEVLQLYRKHAVIDHYSIYDLTGRTLMSVPGSAEFINVSGLPPGIYIIMAGNHEVVSCIRFVKN